MQNIHEKPPEDILDSIPKDIATMPPTMESYRQELNNQQHHQQGGLHHNLQLQFNPQKQAIRSNANQNREAGLKDLRIPSGSAEILKNWPTKGHKCNICHKMFSRPFVLKTHIRS